MAASLESLQAAIGSALGARVRAQVVDRGQLTIEVPAADIVAACTILRDDPALHFEELIDIAGIDYQGHARMGDGPRFAVNYNLLSIKHNIRVRIRAFCPDDDFPSIESVLPVWP